MSRVQVSAVVLTVILSALDGYDVLSVTFAAPAITVAWGVGKAALGVVLSSGLAGMAVGSLLIAPLADVVGRRRLILASLVLMGLGSLLSAYAHSLGQLATWRVLTGLGIGSCIAVINPVAAEFSNAKRRPLALALMAMGYPVGGLVGGLLATALLERFGWRAIFVIGSVAAAALIPVVAIALPESLSFLINRRNPDALPRLNALLGRCGKPSITSIASAPLSQRGGYAGVFARDQIAATARLTVVNMLTVSVIYFVLSWLPQMVADAGFSPSSAGLVSSIANIVGIGGGLLLGLSAHRFGLNRMTCGAILGFGLSTAAFGFTPPTLALLMIAAGTCGFFLFASIAGIYATLAVSFPDHARASGAGFVIGIGRVSSALAPAFAGWLFADGFGRGGISLTFGCFAIVAALLLVGHRTPLWRVP
ncbi:MAG: hypothetical protein JWR80_4404 [Bradyrhizobium sp.]|nr:hypothetical protein [Bradyrhizobium sp.]